MKILQISDTHNRHRLLTNLPEADVIVHCGDFADNGTEGEVLDFLNWFMDLPYPYKLFVAGNHDLCLWDALDIEDLPDNVFFLQDRLGKGGKTFKIIKFRTMVMGAEKRGDGLFIYGANGTNGPYEPYGAN